MNRNLNQNQFITVYRGLNEVEPEEITTPHNIHWTENPRSASHFALNRDEWGYPRDGGEWDDGEPSHDHGTVVEAEVDPRHVIRRGTPEHDEIALNADILHEGSFEDETTLRPGATVHVTAHHYMEEGENHEVARTVRYDPPRKEPVR